MFAALKVKFVFLVFVALVDSILEISDNSSDNAKKHQKYSGPRASQACGSVCDHPWQVEAK
jgi:hypothetical protein